MIRPIMRAAGVALLGAIAGAVSVALAFTADPEIAVEMDRDLPRNISGIYSPERVEDVTFAWTSGRAELALDELNRGAAWICTLRFRGGRETPTPQPVVDVAVDGIRVASSVATNEYQELEIAAPPRQRQGLVLTMAVAPTAVPGPRDPRQLGVQLDRLACRPDSGGALPPRRTLAAAATAGATLGAAFGLINVTAGVAAGAAVLLGIAQAVPLATGLAPYVDHGRTAIRLAVWIGLAMVLFVRGAEWWSGQRLRNTARFVATFSGAVLYLQLLALLHPSKTIVDAVFQAHRLEWVLAGRLLFTQSLGSGVQFPYAIGLYVFAAPFTVLTNDHVALLRIVVSASEIMAGTCLYLMVVRAWGDRLVGAVATGLFSLAPMKYVFIGAANLTNVFGQSVALLTVAALTILSLRPGQVGHVMILVTLAAWAFLCHVSTISTLMTTLIVTAFLYWWRGGPALRAPAHRTMIATAVAATLSIVLYYGHFVTVYKNALRVRTQSISGAQAPTVQPATGEAATGVTTRYRTFTPFPVRVRDALGVTVQSIGWPILVLAGVGAWRTWVGGARDRLTFAVLGWTVTYAIFLAIAVMRIDVHYQRYSYEFVGRLTFATYPAAIILAACGAAWAWRAGRIARMASGVLLLSAVIVGVQNWLQWLQ